MQPGPMDTEVCSNARRTRPPVDARFVPAALRRAALAAAALLLVVAPAANLEAKGKDSDWPEITAEEKGLTSVPGDPDAVAVILQHTRDGAIIPEGKGLVNLINYHKRIKILKPAGSEKYGQVEIETTKRWRAENLEARTVKADGTVVPVAADQIFEKVLEKGRGRKVTALVFNFPAVEPGAILEYRFQRHSKNLILIDSWQFSDDEYTILSRMTQAVPAESNYMYMCDKCPNPDPQVADWKEGRDRGKKFTLEMRGVPPVRHEIFMPPPRDANPRFEMFLRAWNNVMWDQLGRTGNLFTDWPSVAKFCDFDYRRSYMINQTAIAPLVADWTQGAASQDDKIRAIFRHVQSDLRLDEEDFVNGSVRSIPDILKSGEADNEEKPMILLAALRVIGLEPMMALVAGWNKGMLHPDFYSLAQFSHDVVAIQGSDGSLQWLDPTATWAPYGFLPWQDSGASALLIKKDGAQLVTLPQSAQASLSKYDVTLRPRADGTSDLEAAVEFQGDAAVEMRGWLAPASEAARRTELEGWLKEKQPGATLQSFEFADLDAVDKPLRIQLKAEATGLVTRAEDILAVHGCVFDCYDANPMPAADRRLPLYVETRRQIEQRVAILPPDGMRAGPMPRQFRAETATGNTSFACTGRAEGGVQCTRMLGLVRNRWRPEAAPEMRKLFDTVVSIDRSTVTFQAGAAPAAAAPAGTN